MRARRFLSSTISIPFPAVLALLVLTAHPSHGADEEGEGAMILVGVEDSLRVYQIDEIVIRRTRATRLASPVAFTNVTHEEIQRVSYGQDVPMVLSTTPSAYAYSDAANGFGYTYLKIRGFDQNRLGMLVNGVPLNDPEAHQVYWVDHGDLLAGAQSVQVQRGVGTPLFGATSFGGGVNVVTSPLAVDPGLHLEVGYGAYTQRGLDLPVRVYRTAFASGPIRDGTAALYARYSRLNGEGYRVASAADQESFGISGLHAGILGDHKIDLLVGNERTQFAWDGISPQLGFDLKDREDRRHNPYAVYDNNVDDFAQVVASLTSGIPIGRHLSITNTVYYVDGEGFFEQFKEGRDFYDYGFESPDTTVDQTDLVQRRWLRNSYWGLLPQIEIPIAGGTGTFGAGLRRYESAHYGEIVWTDVDVTAGPLDRYYRYDTEKMSFEGYGQLRIPLVERTILTAALQYQGHRYDYRQARIGNFRGYRFEADHDFLNPRIGVRHAFSPRLDLYGSIGFAQREPSDSDYLDGDDPSAVPAFEGAEERLTGLTDPVVKPERVIDYEIGAGLSGSSWDLRVGLYRLDFRDELIPIDGGRIEEEGRLARANAKRTLHQGVEMEGAVRPFPALSLSANLSVARHRYADHEIFAYWIGDYEGGAIRYDGKTIPRTPELLGNLSALYERGSLRVNGRLRHAGKQYVDGENTEALAIDPHTIVDVLLGYDLADRLALPRPLRVEARVNNLFDALYETWGYSYYDDFPPRQFAFYWPGPTRSFFLGIGTTL